MPVLAGATTTPGAGAGSFTHALQGAPTAAAPSGTSPPLWRPWSAGPCWPWPPCSSPSAVPARGRSRPRPPRRATAPDARRARHAMYLTGGLLAVAALAVRAGGQRAASAVPVP
jgi:hypothetical protein